MEKRNKWIKCIGGILLAALVNTISGVSSWFIPQGSMTESEYSIITFLYQGIAIVIGCILILVLFKKKNVLNPFVKGSLKTGLIVSILWVIDIVYYLVINAIALSGAKPALSPLWGALNIIAYFFAAGIGEELSYRGITMNLLRDAIGNKTRKGLIISIVVSSLIFGLSHLTNLFVTDDVIGTIGQIICATGIGIMIAAIYARCKNIWVTIILHFLHDLPAALDTIYAGSERSVSEYVGRDGSQLIIWCFALGMIYATIGFFLVRKKKMNEIIADT